MPTYQIRVRGSKSNRIYRLEYKAQTRGEAERAAIEYVKKVDRKL